MWFLFAMTLYFEYKSTDFSFSGNTFGGNVITDFDCGLDFDTNNNYERISFDVDFDIENENVSTLLSTLAETMYYWCDYDAVSNKEDLLSLINSRIVYYGENIASYYGKDDWDDYIVLMLICQKLLQNDNITDDDVISFVVFN